jgi:predicted deacetylase
VPSKAIWSVHDVSSQAFEDARRILETLEAAEVRPLCVLVVPDGAWSVGQIDVIRGWERAGHMLGLHGWSHRAVLPRTLYHRLHAALFSRDIAEHLGRGEAEIAALIAQGERWFADHDLRPPALYVPPAWALGALPLAAFDGTPFRWVETLTGIYDVRARRHRRLPLVGFEADTLVRQVALRASNRANEALAAATGRPLRIAVHPHDPELRLNADLTRHIRGATGAVLPDAISRRRRTESHSRPSG